MQTALVSPFSPVTVAPFAVGDLVVNFGQAARVVALCDNGDLILRVVGKTTKWRADAAKCRPAL
jgi:hypothetical protein